MRSEIIKKISIIVLSILLIISTLLTGFVYTFAATEDANPKTETTAEASSDKDTASNKNEAKTDATKETNEKTKEAKVTDDNTVTISEKDKDKTEKEETKATEEEDAFKVSEQDQLAFDVLYFEKHLDSEMVKKDTIDMRTVVSPITFAKGVATYNASKQSTYKADKNFFAGVNYEVPIYDIDKDSDYYVAKPNVNLFSDKFGIYDVYVGYNNDQAEKIDGIYKNGILYIPKKSVDSPQNKYEVGTSTSLAIQTNYYFKEKKMVESDVKNSEVENMDFSKKIPLEVTVDTEGKTKKTSFKVENLFDGYVKVKDFVSDPESYKKDDFSIMLNGMAMSIGEDAYAYDSKTGEIIINASPAALSNIQIIVKGKSKASKVASAVMSTVFDNAYAADDKVSQNDMKTYVNRNGNTAVLSFDTRKMFIGWRGYHAPSKDESNVLWLQYSGNAGLKGHDKAKDQCIENLIKKAGPSWKNSIKYMYGAYTGNYHGATTSIWALSSYTAGANKTENSGDVGKITSKDSKVRFKTEQKKKTIYEWMMAYRNSLKLGYNQAGNTRPQHNSNGLGGYTNFAIRWQNTWKGSKLALTPSGQKNESVTFSSTGIGENTWLAATCVHLADKQLSDGDSSQSIYVSCLGLTDNYIVLSFTSADNYGSTNNQSASAIYKFKIASTAPPEVKIEKTGKITGKAAAGAEYTIDGVSGEGKGKHYVKKTNDSGHVNFGSLKNGEYTLKETKAPDDMLMDKTIYKIVVSTKKVELLKNGEVIQTIGNNSYIKLTDDEKMSLGIEKTDNKSKDRISGAEFTLTNKAGTDSYAKTITADKDKTVYFDNLRTGIYQLAETKAPNGYESLAGVITVTISKTDSGRYKVTTSSSDEIKDQIRILDEEDVKSTISIEDKKLGKLEIYKYVDGNKNEPIQGAEFSLFPNNTYNLALAEKRVTLEDGTARWENLKPGTYRLEETKLPDGYIKKSGVGPFTVTVADDGTTSVKRAWGAGSDETIASNKKVEIPNIKLATLSFTKVDSKTGKGIKGITFNLKGKSGDGSSYNNNKTSDENGIVKFECLENGTYSLTEAGGDNNYNKLNSSYTITVSDYKVTSFMQDGTDTDLMDGKADVASVSLKNVQKKLSLSIHKVDSEDKKTPVEGAGYKLSCDDTGNETMLQKKTDKDGIATFDGPFADGTYTLVEVGSPDEYLLNSTEYKIVIKDGEIESVNGVKPSNDQGSLLNGNGSGVQIENDNIVAYEKKKPTLTFYKFFIDKNGMPPVQNAKFTMTKYGKGSDGTNGYQYYDSATSDENGIVEFKKPMDDGTYQIIESVVPSNATLALANCLNSALFFLEVSVQNGKIIYIIDAGYSYDLRREFDFVKDASAASVAIKASEKTITASYPNQAKASVKIQKKDSATKDGLYGATFSIYKDGASIATAKTDNDGVATFKNLDSGDYIIKETNAPKNYANSLYYWKVKVVNDGDFYFGVGPNDVSSSKQVSYKTYSVKTNEEVTGSGMSGTLSKNKILTFDVLDQKYVDIKIIKDDESDASKLLAGATFNLKNADDNEFEYDKTSTTGSDGSTVFKNLVDGHYILTETQAPDGYEKETESGAYDLVIKEGKIASVKERTE